MRSPSFLIGWPLLVVLVAPSAISAADSSTDHASPSIAAQPNDPGNLRVPQGQPSDSTTSRVPARQPSESTTLEVAPQPSDKVPAPDKGETAEQREFRQSRQDEIARLNRNFHPHDVEDSHRPYLGIDLEYTTQCYLGMEEHGFEVVSVYPNSPAARAGLIARTGSTPAGELKALGSVVARAGCVDDVPAAASLGGAGHRRRSDRRGGRRAGAHAGRRFVHELGHLKPGDTTYITVIRPLPGGYHRTMRIALHIDHETDAAGNILPLPGTSPDAAPSVATESVVN